MDLLRDVTSIVEGASERMRKINLFQTPRLFCDVYVLRAGQSQASHAHAGSDKVYVVLSGSGVVRVDDASHDVRAGHAILCPAGSTHGVEAAGPDDLRLLVLMAPLPA